MNTLLGFKISSFLFHIFLFSFLSVFVIIAHTVIMAMILLFIFVSILRYSLGEREKQLNARKIPCVNPDGEPII